MHVYVCRYACTYVGVCLCVWMYVCIHACMGGWMNGWMHVCTDECMMYILMCGSVVGWVGGWMGAAANEEFISCDLMAIQMKCCYFSIGFKCPHHTNSVISVWPPSPDRQVGGELLWAGHVGRSRILMWVSIWK